MEEPVNSPGSAGRREMWAGGAGLHSSTDVERLVPPLEKGDARSELSEWELRERREREKERLAEEEELAAARELPLLLDTHALMASTEGLGSGDRLRFLLFLCFVFHSRSVSTFLCDSLGATYLLGTGLGGGQRGACNVPPPRGQRARKAGKMYAAIV